MEQSAPAGEEILRQIRFILPKSRGRRSYRIFYIHTFPGSLRTLTISNSSISDHLSSRFSTSCTNGPRLLSRAKAGTHSAHLKESHTSAHTAKQGGFPPSATAQSCATSEITLNAISVIPDSATLLYTYISRFSVPPLSATALFKSCFRYCQSC